MSAPVPPGPVGAACIACFPKHQNDCSGFARAVAEEVKVPLVGLANEIVATLRTGKDWTALAGTAEAATQAKAGLLVIAGLEGNQQAKPDPHGHVAIVLGPDPQGSANPLASWGRLGGGGQLAKTINYAWTHADLPKVVYAAHPLPGGTGKA